MASIKRTKKDPAVQYSKKRSDYKTLRGWENYKKRTENAYYEEQRRQSQQLETTLGSQELVGFGTSNLNTYFIEYRPGQYEELAATIESLTREVSKESRGRTLLVSGTLLAEDKKGNEVRLNTQIFRALDDGNDLRPLSSSLRNSKGERRLSLEDQGAALAIVQEIAGMEALYETADSVEGVEISFEWEIQ